jgi:hypothetical protein
MNKFQYEQKKALLKRIKNAWRDRLQAVHLNRPTPTTLRYGELVHQYQTSKDRLERFMHTSIYWYRLRLIRDIDSKSYKEIGEQEPRVWNYPVQLFNADKLVLADFAEMERKLSAAIAAGLECNKIIVLDSVPEDQRNTSNESGTKV